MWVVFMSNVEHAIYSVLIRYIVPVVVVNVILLVVVLTWFLTKG